MDLHEIHERTFKLKCQAILIKSIIFLSRKYWRTKVKIHLTFDNIAEKYCFDTCQHFKVSVSLFITMEISKQNKQNISLFILISAIISNVIKKNFLSLLWKNGSKVRKTLFLLCTNFIHHSGSPEIDPTSSFRYKLQHNTYLFAQYSESCRRSKGHNQGCCVNQ
jgi:hypothetical protein